MRTIRRTLRTVLPVVGRALLCAGLLCLAATEASAIPYFTENCGVANCGFDNEELGLDVDVEIDLDATFFPVTSEPPDNLSGPLGLIAMDVINDTMTSIDRTITWTLINNEPGTITDFLIFFTALAPTQTDYSGADIDLGIDEFDDMLIARLGSFYFAGYRLTLDDFAMVGSDLVATRSFRYTVNVPEGPGGPPRLGIAYTMDITPVPEPATGLLLTGALLVAMGAGRKRRA